MDSITQAALGASIGEAVLGRKIGHKGAILGAIVATIPDLDTIFYLFYSKFEMLSIHRGYSHSIVVSFLGAFLLAFIFKRIKWTSKVSYQRLFLFSWLTWLTHALLDTFTAYGTQLFLPFSDARIGFDSINIIDPIYTLPLLIGLFCSLILFRKKPSKSVYNYIGIIISTTYLISTLGIKFHVEKHFNKTFSEQNIEYNELLTMPVGVASLKWYGVAKSSDKIYMQKFSILSKETLLFENFPINDHLLNEINPHASERMRWFAKGFYTVIRDGNKIRIYNLQVDMRGVIHEQNGPAPTAGYFEITPQTDGGFKFGSGAHQVE